MTQEPPEDLSWADRPEETEARRERRRARREEHRRKRRRKRRIRNVLLGVGFAGAVVVVVIALWLHSILGGISRMPAVAGQAGADTPGTNYLLVGRNPLDHDDPLSAGPLWQGAMAASDLVMVIHVSRDHRSAYVVSIPGTALLPIPGQGRGTLHDAYATGGAPLYVRTLEEWIGARFDRVMAVSLNGIRETVDQLGGIVVGTPRDGCDFTRGQHRVDGQTALEYVALRPCLPSGDLDRVQRQQSLLKGVLHGIADGGAATHPLLITDILRSLARNLTLEDGFSTLSEISTAWSLRRLRTTNTTFLTVPVAADPFVTRGKQRLVRLDEPRDQQLWAALRTDTIGEYLQLTDDAAVLG